MAAGPVTVDVVLDDAEEREIACHDDEGDEPRHSCDHGREQGAKDTGAKREEERDEGEAAGDGVENHDAGEGLGCVFGRGAEGRGVDLGHDVSRVVANDLGEAEILIGPDSNVSCALRRGSGKAGEGNIRDRRHIENAVTKGSEGHGGVADISLVGEHDLQDRNVPDDGCGDGRDEEEDRRGEEEEGADMVEDSGLGHLDGVDGCCSTGRRICCRCGDKQIEAGKKQRAHGDGVDGLEIRYE